MAQPTGTFDEYDAKGLREELADIIYDISPMDTPFMSAIARESCASIHPEWQLDVLAAAADNAHITGDDAEGQASVATTRVGNYTQIGRKEVTISGTDEVVDKAGRRSEVSYQLAKKGRELKRDIEFTASGNYASVVGTNTVARHTGSLEAWIASNAQREATTGAGASGGFSTTTNLVVAATDSTVTRALTEAFFQQGAQDAWQDGGNPTMALVGPGQKRVISTFNQASAIERQETTADKTMTVAIDVYRHDFGTLRVVPSRFNRNRTVCIIDPALWSLKWLRPIHQFALAKTGDSHKRMIVGEWTLCSRQEEGNAVIADLA